jgi:hypothetical protein
MPGGFMPVKGSSIPPTKSWFGLVPDKLSMLLPMYNYNDGAIFNVYFKNMGTVDYINKMIPWDTTWDGAPAAASPSCTLGSTTTAPDGTSTAYKVVETTVNNYHIMIAGFNDQSLLRAQTKRFAVFAKAAERTRCWLGVATSRWSAANENGVYAVFDLAGGQVGVTGTAYGSSLWVPLATQIIPYGNGWYLCYIDVGFSGNDSARSFSVISCGFGTDAGSGIGAAQRSFVGDASKGVYAWRVNCLPPRAWAMNNVTFFDDFTSTATIDMANTKAPGFNWYVDGSWPQPGFDSTVFMNNCAPCLSVASSVLTITPVHNGAPNANLALTTSTGTGSTGNLAGTYVGTPLTPSNLLEYRFAYDRNVIDGNGGFGQGGSTFSVTITGINNTIPGGPLNPTYSEIDQHEQGGPADQIVPLYAVLTAQEHNLSVSGYNGAFVGYPAWCQGITYGNTSLASFNGHVYQSQQAGNQNKQPDINVPAWWVNIDSSLGAANPTLANSTLTDFNQMHTKSVLWIKDKSQYSLYDTGEVLEFWDGVLCFPAQPPGVGGTPSDANAWGQTLYGSAQQIQPNPYAEFNDYWSPGFMLQIGGNATLGSTSRWDWLRITQ